MALYVDSQAAKKKINSSSSKSIATLDSKNALIEMRDCIKVSWVPGHFNTVENELANELTRGGSQSVDLRLKRL